MSNLIFKPEKNTASSPFSARKILSSKWTRAFSLLLALVALDQTSKHVDFGLLQTWPNKGFIFGLYADVDPLFRIIFLSTLFGFLFSLYVVALYFLPHRRTKAIYGSTLMIAGMAGNVIDRALLGHAIDFLPLHLGENFAVVFNLADLFQWPGAILIVWDYLSFIPGPSNRKTMIILPKEQLRMATKFLVVTLATGIIFGLFSYTFMRTVVLSKLYPGSTQIMTLFLVSYCLLLGILGLWSFAVGLAVSHRSAGPLYAFERHINDLIADNQVNPLLFRQGDHYRHLLILAQKIQDHLRRTDKAG
jgi:signal peptidase II